MSPDTVGLLQLLEDQSYITESTRLRVTQYCQRWHVSPYDALLATHLFSETELADAVASLYAVPRVGQLSAWKIAEESLEIIPFHAARAWTCLLLRTAAPLPVLVTADPSDAARISEIKQGLSGGMTLAVAERSDIVRAIDELYPLSAQLPSLYGTPTPAPT